MSERLRWIGAFSIYCFLLTMGQSLAAQVPQETAWQVLQEGIGNKDAHTRAVAIRSLGLASGDGAAEKLAIQALKDTSVEVRIAAATTLGKLNGKNSVDALKEALKDPEIGVILSAASSLRSMGDPSAYLVYYAILTGERKSGEGLVDEQKKLLSDPKKLARVGFEQGIGFVPFASLGYGALKTLTKDDDSPIRAAAAVALAADEDPRTGAALLIAAKDKSWMVRAAALDSIARRNDPALIKDIMNSLIDAKPEVRYTAAAAVYHLSTVSSQGTN